MTAPQEVVLTGAMTYAAARAAFAAAWPRVPVMWYRPTIEHYKEGYPTAAELELEPGERLGPPDSAATLSGGLTGRELHSTVMRAFSLETALPGVGLSDIWMATLDEADAGVRRPRPAWKPA